MSTAVPRLRIALVDRCGPRARTVTLSAAEGEASAAELATHRTAPGSPPTCSRAAATVE